LLGFEDYSSQKGHGFKIQFIVIIYYILFLSSPYLLVCDDDRVTCFTGAAGVSGGTGNA